MCTIIKTTPMEDLSRCGARVAGSGGRAAAVARPLPRRPVAGPDRGAGRGAALHGDHPQNDDCAQRGGAGRADEGARTAAQVRAGAHAEWKKDALEFGKRFDCV
jgi:hypothetical protein